MVFSVLTYNLLYGSALTEVKEIVQKYQPDILCLQEFPITDEDKKISLLHNYKLASSANSFIKWGQIFGLATFYNQKRTAVSFLENQKIPHTFFDWVRFFRNFFKKRVKREFLKTVFKFNGSKKTVAVFNIHLTAEATNEARINQVKEILKATKKISLPLIIVGDFNYAFYRRKKLEKLFQEYNFKEATANIDYTFFAKKRLFLYDFITKLLIKIATKFFPEKFKLDFIFYRKVKLISCQRIESKISDHYPLIAKFKI